MNEIDLVAIVLTLGTILIIYFNLMIRIGQFKELNNLLTIQTQFAEDLKKDREKMISGLKYELTIMRKEIDDMATELNGINLKLGLKLK